MLVDGTSFIARRSSTRWRWHGRLGSTTPQQRGCRCQEASREGERLDMRWRCLELHGSPKLRRSLCGVTACPCSLLEHPRGWRLAARSCDELKTKHCLLSCGDLRSLDTYPYIHTMADNRTAMREIAVGCKSSRHVRDPRVHENGCWRRSAVSPSRPADRDVDEARYATTFPGIAIVYA